MNAIVTKPVRNAIFKRMLEVGLDPAKFEWSDLKDVRVDDYEFAKAQVLSYTPNSGEYRFAVFLYGSDYRVVYTPGERTLQVDTAYELDLPRLQVLSFEWINALVQNLGEPDLWSGEESPIKPTRRKSVRKRGKRTSSRASKAANSRSENTEGVGKTSDDEGALAPAELEQIDSALAAILREVESASLLRGSEFEDLKEEMQILRQEARKSKKTTWAWAFVGWFTKQSVNYGFKAAVPKVIELAQNLARTLGF